MDTLTVNPLFTSSCFIKPPRYSFFKFYKTSRIYSQITPSTCPQNPKKSKQNQFTNWVVPVLQRVKLLASSQKRKWVLLLQAYSDESEKSMNECCGGNEYLQNGAFGLALLSITSHAKEMGFEDTVCLWRDASSHSGLCTALTTSVALCHGVADSLFPVCLGSILIVMYDAIGVRRHAGMQAEVLNMIVADLFQAHPVSQRKLKKAHPAH